MSWIKECRLHLRSLFRKSQVDRELDEELRLHIERQTEENIAAGMTLRDAREAALRGFGATTLIKEECRDMRGWNLLETLFQDLRYATRMLTKSPGLTATVVLSLALGIGANTAIFSLVDAVLLKSLPVRNPQQLIVLNWAAPKWPSIVQSMSGSWYEDEKSGTTSTALSYPFFERVHANAGRVLSGVFALSNLGDVNIGVNGNAGLEQGQLVSGDYFSTLGVQLVLGRALVPQDNRPGAAPAAVIGYDVWQERFGGDPSVAGKAITINGAAFTVAGVAPPEFFGVQPGSRIDVWIPLRMQPLVDPRATQPNKSNFEDAGNWWVVVMGRMRPGVTETQARAALAVIFQQSIEPLVKPPAKPSEKPEILPRMEVESAANGLDALRREFSKSLFVLLAVVALVLLIACANVANLLLGRASAREKEIAVRLAIGAGRRRLIRQFLTESVLLALIGGAAGLALAFWASDLLVRFFIDSRDLVTLDVSPDLKILSFTAAVSVLTGILFGLAPALRGTRLDLTPALKSAVGNRGGSRLGLSKTLVVSQVALCLLLLVGAGLFVRTLQNLETANLGFNPSNLLLFRVDPTQSGYKEARLANFYRDLQVRVAALPGVRSASMSANPLVGGNISMLRITIQGAHPKDARAGDTSDLWNRPGSIQINFVGPNFLKTMGIPLLLGRSIGSTDDASAPKIAVVNELAARQIFGNRNAIGHRFGFGDAKSSGDVEIVGIAANAKYSHIREKDPAVAYIPCLQASDRIGPMYFEMRTAGNPLDLVSSVRHVLRNMDKNIPLSDVKTQTQLIGQKLFHERLFARLTGLFSLLSLLLACVGLYGIMSYAVTRRTREIGIRMALGAERRDILIKVLRETLFTVIIGVAIGIPAALAATHVIKSQLFGLTATDPATVAGATLILVLTAAIAGYIPARRASRVDPTIALREE